MDFVHSIVSQPDSIEHQTSGSTLLKSWVLPVDFVHSIASQAEGIEHQMMDMLKLWIPRYKVSDKLEIQNYEIQIYQIQELEQILRERGPDM